MKFKSFDEDDLIMPMRSQPDLFLEQRGFIYAYGEISQDMSFELTKSLHRSIISGADPICIFINSNGGDAESAISIYDQIQFLKGDIKATFLTIGCGDISSGATILLQAGHKRYMTENSIFMVHEPAYNMEGPTSQHKDTMVGAELIFKIWLGILTKTCKTPVAKKKIESLFDRKESYLNATQCKRLGLIDEVLKYV